MGKGKKQKRAEQEGGERADPQPSSTAPAARKHTLSLAIPGACLETAPSIEYATYVAGQIARLAVAFHLDEIVVYDDTPATGKDKGTVSSATAFLGRVLQYLETPPYLRSLLIPKDADLAPAAALPPLGAQHHLQTTEWLPYREGVVLKSEESIGSYVDIGLDRMCHIKQLLPVNARVTVHVGHEASTKFMEAYSETMILGEVAPPSAPREKMCLTWGYSVRIAQGLARVLKDCPFHKGGYDLTIGVSPSGALTNPGTLELPRCRHALLVLDNSGAGPGGAFEDMLARDPDPFWSAKLPQDAFNLFVNVCPGHPGPGLRAEDGAPAALAYLQPAMANAVASS